MDYSLTNIIDLNGNVVAGANTEAPVTGPAKPAARSYDIVLSDDSIIQKSGYLAVTGAFTCLADNETGEIFFAAPWAAVKFVIETPTQTAVAQ